MPSKILLRSGEVLAEVMRVPSAAAAVTGVIDPERAFHARDAVAAHWRDDPQVQWLDNAGATLVRGRGRLAGVRRVDVQTPDGEVRELEARRAVVLATGSSPSMPPIEGLRDIHVWDSRDATSAAYVPERLLVLGGGAVGVEMAQAWKRLGASQVTMLCATERLLSRVEPFAAEELRAAFVAEGIGVELGIEAVRVARAGDDGPVTLTLADGRTFTADELLVAAGRRPNTTDLGLETVGLEPGKPVEVDGFLRARGVDGDWLYAIGDVNGRNLLTHMGKYQARVAVDVILRGSTTEAWADERAVPAVVFTDPQVAWVGLTEQEARKQGMPVRVLRHGTGDVAGAAVHGRDIKGTSQLVVDESRRVVVGATFTGPVIGEMLHAATIAIVSEVTLDRLVHAVPVFPTISEVWLRMLESYGL